MATGQGAPEAIRKQLEEARNGPCPGEFSSYLPPEPTGIFSGLDPGPEEGRKAPFPSFFSTRPPGPSPLTSPLMPGIPALPPTRAPPSDSGLPHHPPTPCTPAHSPRSSGDILQPSARQTPGPRVSIWTHQSHVPVTTLKHSSSDDQEMRVGPWQEHRLPPRG